MAEYNFVCEAPSLRQGGALKQCVIPQLCCVERRTLAVLSSSLVSSSGQLCMVCSSFLLEQNLPYAWSSKMRTEQRLRSRGCGLWKVSCPWASLPPASQSYRTLPFWYRCSLSAPSLSTLSALYSLSLILRGVVGNLLNKTTLWRRICCHPLAATPTAQGRWVSFLRTTLKATMPSSGVLLGPLPREHKKAGPLSTFTQRRRGTRGSWDLHLSIWLPVPTSCMQFCLHVMSGERLEYIGREGWREGALCVKPRGCRHPSGSASVSALRLPMSLPIKAPQLCKEA